MGPKWHEILALVRTPLGRFELLHSLSHRAWPLLSRWAILHRRTLARKTRNVAVIGSFGKSTTVRAVHAALGRQPHAYALWGGSSAVARAVLRIRPWDRHAVIEVAIDRPGQMATYARVVRPDIAVVMSVGSEHNSSLKTLEITRAEKAAMVQSLLPSGLAVLNGDDPNVLWMRSQTRAHAVTFGVDKSTDIQASDITLDWPYGTRFILHVGDEVRYLRIRLIGKHMVYPILAAVAVALAEGLSLDQVIPALEALSPTPGRLEPIRLANGAVILCDDFKSALETIETALDVLSDISAQRRIVVLGEISEPPGSQGPIYRRLGERVAQVASDAFFIGTGDSVKRYKTGAKRGGLPQERIHRVRNVSQAIGLLGEDIGPGDVVLIKGRSAQRLDRVSLALMGRTVRCETSLCKARLRCRECPMLEQGWKGVPAGGGGIRPGGR